MGKSYWGEWLKAALIRAVKTFAQTAAASITVGATMAEVDWLASGVFRTRRIAGCIAVGAAASEVDWLRVLSVSGVAFVLSMLTSLGGLPEVDKVGYEFIEDEYDDQYPEDDQGLDK